jgi:putative ABC transport system substrate-binding protein
LSTSAASQTSFAGKTVCVDQYASASVISDILTGLNARLASAKQNGLTITVKNPQGDAATEATIAQQYVSGGCSVLVPVGTAAAELYANQTKTIPIVFAASSTPVQAKLVKSLTAPGGNVTGVSDVLPINAEIDAMKQVMPNLKSVGLIWTLGDPAGDADAQQAKTRLAADGLTAVDATITSAADITQAVESLHGKVQAIYLPGDTKVIGAAGGIVKTAEADNLPVFGATSSTVQAGGILAGSYDYVTVGKQVGDLVLKVLGGAHPATTPVLLPPVHGFDLNTTEAAKLGLTIPSGLLAEATHKY